MSGILRYFEDEYLNKSLESRKEKWQALDAEHEIFKNLLKYFNVSHDEAIDRLLSLPERIIKVDSKDYNNCLNGWNEPWSIVGKNYEPEDVCIFKTICDALCIKLIVSF